MKLEVGKRYVRRDGEISGVIDLRSKFCMGDYKDHPYVDRTHGYTYTSEGFYFRSNNPDSWELVQEYNETVDEPEPISEKVYNDMTKDFTLVEHLKNNKGNYIGTLVAIGGINPHEYSIGWAKFNHILEPKTSLKEMKKKGLEIAMGRAKKKVLLYSVNYYNDGVVSDGAPLPNFPPSLSYKMSKFIERCKRYYQTTWSSSNIGAK